MSDVSRGQPLSIFLIRLNNDLAQLRDITMTSKRRQNRDNQQASTATNTGE